MISTFYLLIDFNTFLVPKLEKKIIFIVFILLYIQVIFFNDLKTENSKLIFRLKCDTA